MSTGETPPDGRAETPEVPPVETPTVAGAVEKTAQERKEQLDAALQWKSAEGWRIEDQSEFQATIAKGKNHPLSLFRREGLKRQTITVDPYGNMVEQEL